MAHIGEYKEALAPNGVEHEQQILEVKNEERRQL